MKKKKKLSSDVDKHFYQNSRDIIYMHVWRKETSEKIGLHNRSGIDNNNSGAAKK